MSHDIQTPLNAIIGFSQLLTHPNISNEEKRQYCHNISCNAEMMMMLMEDILNIPDIEAGKYKFTLEPVSCNEICRNVLNMTEMQAMENVRMDFTSDVDDSHKITTDKKRIQQILINLLSNACKHTTEGHIHLHCSTAEHPRKNTFTISDTGCGIAPEQAQKIFKRFTIISETDGHGLGLNICKTIATQLNAEIMLDTQEIQRNQTLCTSRSFGNMINDLASLKASVATFASSCANKLRGQHSGACTVTVFITSNRFREDLPQYANAASIQLGTPTNDTLEITQAALQALQHIYIPGIMYKKSGVIVSNIQAMDCIQANLFDPIPNRQQRSQLMHAIDTINHHYGLKSVQLGIEGPSNQPWKVRCEHRSPNYLTDINEILTINI